MSAKLKHLPSVITATTSSASASLSFVAQRLERRVALLEVAAARRPLLFSLSTPTASTIAASTRHSRLRRRERRPSPSRWRRRSSSWRRRRTSCRSPLLDELAAAAARRQQPDDRDHQESTHAATHLLERRDHTTEAHGPDADRGAGSRGAPTVDAATVRVRRPALSSTGPGMTALTSPARPTLRSRVLPARAHRPPRVAARPRARGGRVPHRALPRAPRPPRRRARAHDRPPGPARVGRRVLRRHRPARVRRAAPSPRCGSSR